MKYYRHIFAEGFTYGPFASEKEAKSGLLNGEIVITYVPKWWQSLLGLV